MEQAKRAMPSTTDINTGSVSERAHARGLRDRSDSQEEVTSLGFSPMSETTVSHHPVLSLSSRVVPERSTLSCDSRL